MENPWLRIPAEDYEGHMASPGVQQLQFLSSTFRRVLDTYKPESLLVLGCSTGNGFEHIDHRITKRVIGLDLNREYLKIAESRFQKQLPNLELYCGDIQDCFFEPSSFELIHAGLFFEYVKPAAVVAKAAQWLSSGGILSVILQLPSEKEDMVSKTPYKTLDLLNSVMSLVDPDEFSKICKIWNLLAANEETITLETGKEFYVGCFKT